MRKRGGTTSRRRMHGVAAVELEMMLVPLLTLTFGVTEYGRAIYTYNAIDKAARDAARHLTTVLPTNPDPQGQARNLAVYGNIEGTGSPLAPGLTTAMVAIDTQDSVPTGSGVVNLVTVRISGYTYNSIVTYVAQATLAFSDIAVTMRSQL